MRAIFIILLETAWNVVWRLKLVAKTGPPSSSAGGAARQDH